MQARPGFTDGCIPGLTAPIICSGDVRETVAPTNCDLQWSERPSLIWANYPTDALEVRIDYSARLFCSFVRVIERIWRVTRTFTTPPRLGCMSSQPLHRMPFLAALGSAMGIRLLLIGGRRQ